MKKKVCIYVYHSYLPNGAYRDGNYKSCSIHVIYSMTTDCPSSSSSVLDYSENCLNPNVNISALSFHYKITRNGSFTYFSSCISKLRIYIWNVHCIF